MKSGLKSLSTLQSLDADAVARLRELGIQNLGDLLAYPPFRYARYLRAAHDKLLRREEVIGYVDDALKTRDIDELLESSPDVLREVGRKQADILETLGLKTVGELAAFAAVDEAEEIVTRTQDEESDPFAPPCVCRPAKNSAATRRALPASSRKRRSAT